MLGCLKTIGHTKGRNNQLNKASETLLAIVYRLQHF